MPATAKTVQKFQKNWRNFLGRAGTVIKQARDGQFRLFITPHIILYLQHRHHIHHHHHHHYYHHFKPHSHSNHHSKPHHHYYHHLKPHHHKSEADKNPQALEFSNELYNVREDPHYENIFDTFGGEEPDENYEERCSLTKESLKNCQSDKCRVVQSIKSKKLVKRLYTNVNNRVTRRMRYPDAMNDRIKRTY